MDDSLLWVTALAGGALGLLLLSLAGLAAVYLNKPSTYQAPKKRATSKEKPAGHIAPTEQPSPPVDPSTVQPQSPSRISPWAWIKAWIFAIVHAGTVSVVLGGITFFQDLAKASEEIQNTGTVSFPKQLLPGTLSMPSSRQLSEPSANLETGDRHWEVEGLVNEAGIGQK
ncbi:MAG TPA: hypothetical protein ENN19_17155 [Chloroflexi bacterium]|nr:hypothetical protein [Chloroflexota bacterium]